MISLLEQNPDHNIDQQSQSGNGIPGERVYKEWSVLRAPTLCKHLANNGRQAKMVQAARAFAEKAGREALQHAMDMAE